MKLTNEQINKIKILRSNGSKVKDIAEQMNISLYTVSYWTNQETKDKNKIKCKKYFSNLPKEKRKEIYKSRLPYLRNYQKQKYNSDESFREKKKEYSKKYYRRVSK